MMFKFFLDDYNVIKVKYNEKLLNGDLKVLCNGKDVSFTIDSNSTYLFIRLSKEYEDRDVYEIKFDGEVYYVKPRFIVQTKRFEEEYKVDINSLGSFIENDKTVFRLWSPLSTSAFLLIDNSIIEMDYLGKGVFEKIIDDNLDGHLYSYKTIREIDYYFKDPFSYVDKDEKSYVIDSSKLKFKVIKPKSIKNNIIYELNVRDFSSDINAPFRYRKKLLALTEENLKLDGKEVGVDYLESLGVTHLQLMPIFSFDLDGSEYNWGYNPKAFNTIEKSYLVCDKPYEQINEFRYVVNELHKKNLRVNLDVVYNHVYRVKDFDLDKMLPYYFFRYKDDVLGDASYCGNETRSESYFLREYLKYLIERFISVYDIDGLRFDLMGIIDKETMNQIYEHTNILKPGFMIYGEGWNMGDILPDNEKASMDNSIDMKNIAFFNDSFRDCLRGTKIDDSKAFLFGDLSFKENVSKLLSGSNELNFDTNQTLNYVECHDNYTMYDKTVFFFHDETIRRKICRLALSLVVLSKGIPFIHSGQEFLRTKNGLNDSYNVGDLINKLDWNRKNSNEDLVDYLKELINVRNNYDEFIDENVSISFDDYYEVLIYRLNNLTIFINPCVFDHVYNSDDEYHLIMNENGMLNKDAKAFDIPSFSVVVGYKK